MSNRSTPIQSVQVYSADMLVVSSGANQGDPLSWHAELILDDAYVLTSQAERERLSVQTEPDGGFKVASETELGRVGAELHADCAVTFMSPDGQTHEAVVIVELAAKDQIAAIYLLALSDLSPKTEYALVGIDQKAGRERLASVASVYFARGTHITLSTGEQRLIEDLVVGDRVLTRDEGAQEVRWIGSYTLRAHGHLAPVIIKAGALNNTRDLMVSPEHRLFVYQRQDRIGAGHHELMVKARHLVNGDTVRVASGGYVDYFQILFDRHHIIYAEGIAAESMLVDPRTKPSLPSELLERLTEVMPSHAKSDHHGLDVQQALLNRPDAIDILRRASAR